MFITLGGCLCRAAAVIGVVVAATGCTSMRISSNVPADSAARVATGKRYRLVRWYVHGESGKKARRQYGVSTDAMAENEARVMNEHLVSSAPGVFVADGEDYAIIVHQRGGSGKMKMAGWSYASFVLTACTLTIVPAYWARLYEIDMEISVCPASDPDAPILTERRHLALKDNKSISAYCPSAWIFPLPGEGERLYGIMDGQRQTERLEVLRKAVTAVLLDVVGRREHG